jgi:hypothetical protein
MRLRHSHFIQVIVEIFSTVVSATMLLIGVEAFYTYVTSSPFFEGKTSNLQKKLQIEFIINIVHQNACL